MVRFHKIFRWIIYFICLATSSSLIVYFLYSLSQNDLFHWIMPFVVVAIEFLAQYFLALGKSKFKARKRLLGILLISVYAIYVLLFGTLSGIAFFATEVSVNVQSVNSIQEANDYLKKQFDQDGDQIKTLNLQLTTESKSGYGEHSQAIMAEIKQLRADQLSLRDQMNKKAKEQQAAAPHDSFSALAGMIGLNANTLAIIIFGTLCLFVYLGATVLNPSLNLEETDKQTDTKTDGTDLKIETDHNGTDGTHKTETKNKVSLIRPEVTVKETVLKSNETERTDGTDEKAICPICGTEFPKGDGRKIYCSDRCRKIAHKQRNKGINPINSPMFKEGGING